MAITGRNDVMQNIAAGKGFFGQYTTLGPSSATTAAATASGTISVQVYFNTIGTTIPTTLIDLKLPPVTSQMLLTYAQANNTPGSGGLYLARLYKIGTITLTSTGNQLSHDAATFPILRTQFGEVSKPLSLVPIIYITTATTTTAAVLSFQTAAGAAGYTNQDGSSVIGTASNFTMPNIATAINSAFIFRLNTGDSGVRDVNQVRVHTAASAGAATLFGAEFLAPLPQIGDQQTYVHDAMFGGLSMVDLTPGLATSGSATSYLVVLSLGRTANNSVFMTDVAGVLNV